MRRRREPVERAKRSSGASAPSLFDAAVDDTPEAIRERHPVPTEADLRAGTVLVCLDCGDVKANPSNATGSACPCGGQATKYGAMVMARDLYDVPLPPGVVDPDTKNVVTAALGEVPLGIEDAPSEQVEQVLAAALGPDDDDELDFEPLPSPSVEWVTCPGGCGVLKDSTRLTDPCRSCPPEPVNPAPVSHAADPATVARDTPGIVGHASPPQSHAAANALPTGKRRVQVLTVLARQGMTGATAEQMEAHANLGGSTIRPRLLELERDGFVERTSENRATRSGMLAAVYRVTPRGRSAADRLEGRPDGMP